MARLMTASPRWPSPSLAPSGTVRASLASGIKRTDRRWKLGHEGTIRQTGALRDLSFADLSIPASVMTANLAGRCPAPISTGPLWEALMAALAIPGLYSPWVRGGQRLVDAVSLTPVPLGSVVEAGADITIAVNLLGRETLPDWPDDYSGLAIPNLARGEARDTVVEVLELAQLDASARQTGLADVPVTPLFGPGTWRHMHLGSLFFAAGQKAAEDQLSLLGMLARPIERMATRPNG